MDIGQSARPAYAYVPRARLFSRSPRGGCSRMKCDECRHDAVRSSAPCGVCLTFMCKHIQQESSDGDWYFQGATWPDDNWNKTAKTFSDPHHNYGHRSVCPPRLCICPPSEIIFVISSRGVQQHEIWWVQTWCCSGLGTVWGVPNFHGQTHIAGIIWWWLILSGCHMAWWQLEQNCKNLQRSSS